MTYLLAPLVCLQSLKMVCHTSFCQAIELIPLLNLLIGRLQVPSYSNDPRPKIIFQHQNLTLLSNKSFNLMWRILNYERCARYQLVVSQNCDVNSNSIVLINKTKENSIFLEPEVLSNFMYFNLTSYDEKGNQCEDLFLESFQFNPESKFYDNYNMIKK